MPEDLLFQDETYKIIGAAMEVSNFLGHGLHEKPYENALAIELRSHQFRVEQQLPFPVLYKDQVVGEFIPDIIVGRKIIIETKTVESIGSSELGQMMNYLKVTGYKLGIILNFRHAKLEWERVVR
ncbi:MAG: GxxExxY protein [Verrucomicrobiota bacterium]